MLRRLRVTSAALALLATAPALGQPPGPPVLLGVDPPGASVGGDEEWSLTGRDLASARRLVVSGGGIEVLAFAATDGATARARVRVAPDAEPGFRDVRVDGPEGVSNLAIVRIDRLRQVRETRPGGRPDLPQEVEEGSAVAGLLGPLDVDRYRIRGTPGRRLTLDLEARRLGTAIAPVLTILPGPGVATAQAREPRGGDRDVRMTAIVPPAGSFLVEVRDNTYGGSDRARYRLRVDPLPFATAAFPLGGRRGEAVEVEVSGGNLDRPRRKVVRLPDVLGRVAEVGPVDGPGGPIPAPGRLVAGDGPEVTEPADRPGDSPIELAPGATVNGRIARPGEVDAYRLAVKAGDRIGARIEAASLGSWLDSVVVVRDEAGGVVAENDDRADTARPELPRGFPAPGVAEASPDSSAQFEANADGVLTIEVSDRFGDGGPEYGYRLAVGPSRPDYSVRLLLANPQATASGAFHLKPGGSIAVHFLIVPEGRPGPVEVGVEGLPAGVTAERVSVRLAGPARPGSPASPVADYLRISVAADAPPGLSEFRVVASARPEGGPALDREATATVVLAPARPAIRPITRSMARFPLRILGEVRP